jgi:hypothetical protein
VAGGICVALVAAAVLLATPQTSGLVPRHIGGDARWDWLFLGAMTAAFLAYAVGLVAIERAPRLRLAVACGIAAAVQLVPLGGPVLLSTDLYTYWDYGRIGAVHGGNPYSQPPSAFPGDAAYDWMGAGWHRTTSVYGPGFELAAEAQAELGGASAAVAAWTYKTLAALGMLAITALAVFLAAPARRAFAAAFVGWNPLLAVHFAGGGHNDAWMMAFVLGALAAAATRRTQLAGVGWAAAVAVKWVPLVFMPLRALEARRQGRPVSHLGFLATAAVVAGVATWRYGRRWLEAFGPLATNVAKQAQYSIPNRVSGLGISEHTSALLFMALFTLAYVWLLREAWRGRARLALTAGLALVATPWLLPWYALWPVSLAAVEEDRAARWLALGLTAYLLRDAVPL